MADKRINQLDSGSILDSSLGLIGDPVSGSLTQTSYRAMKDYFTAGITGSSGIIDTGSLTTTASFNTFTSSYLNDSASFNTRINSITGSGDLINTGSLLSTSSFNLFTSSINNQINNVFSSESNYLPTASFNTFTSSYLNDSSSLNISINNVFSSESNYLTTSSFNIFTASINNQVSNVYASESNYLSTSSFNIFTSSYLLTSSSINNNIINIFASESNYVLTSSYIIDSSSFDNRINTLSGSLSNLTGSYVTTGSFNTYTASTNLQIANVYASESNYLLTSSFNAFSSSYVSNSSSFTTVSASLNSISSSFNSLSASNASNGSVNLVYSSSIVWNYLSGSVANVTLIGNASLNLISASINSFGIIKVTQDSTGSRALSLPGSIQTSASLSQNPNSVDLLGFYYDGSTFFWSYSNFGTVLTGSGNFDSDAFTFINAANIGDNTQKTAINQLVLDLKNAGIWTKMTAVYPFIGGNAFAHKFNLKDPRDLDAAFRISWTGSVTHNSNGITGNASNAFGNTNINPSASLIYNSTHLSYYERTVVGTNRAMGSQNGTDELILCNIGGMLGRMYSSNSQVSTPANGTGSLIISRTNSNTMKGYYNSNLIVSSSSTTSGSLPPFPIYVLGFDNSGSVTAASSNLAFVSVGSGLTDTEAIALGNATKNFQTTLGRNVV